VLYVWQFRNSFTRQLANEVAVGPAAAAGAGGMSAAAAILQREGREKMFHIDDPAACQASKSRTQQLWHFPSAVESFVL
jgi:hypothetical protein